MYVKSFNLCSEAFHCSFLWLQYIFLPRLQFPDLPDMSERLDNLQRGYATHGEDWVGGQLRRMTVAELRALALELTVQIQAEDGKKQLVEAVSRGIVTESKAVRHRSVIQALRTGLTDHGAPWLRERLDERTVSELRDLGTAVGWQLSVGGAYLHKAQLVSNLMSHLTQSGDLDERAQAKGNSMSWWFSKIFLCCRFYSKNLFLFKWFHTVVDCGFTGDVFRGAKQSSP